MIPPKESRLQYELWLLLVAGYGLINANSKWQLKSDKVLLDPGLQHVAAISQVFVKIDKNGHVLLLIIQILDDIFGCGPGEELCSFVTRSGSIFKLGTIMHGPDRMNFYGLSVVQHESYSCSVDADEKLEAIEA